MPLDFSTDIVGGFYASDIQNDPNYSSPGNYNLSLNETGGVGVASVSVDTAGTYTTAPTATASAGGALFAVQMKLLGGSAIAAAGTNYAPGNTFNITGGTASVPVLGTVSTVKLVSATITPSHAGTGYGNAQTFNVTVAGGTSTTAAVVSVTTNASGVVTTINSVATPGSYTALPSLTGNVVTGDDGTDHGTGLQLNLVFGVLAFAPTNAGLYSAIPASPVATTNVTGTGSGLTLTGSWGVGAVVVTDDGAGTYTSGATPTVVFSAGSAAATAHLSAATPTQADTQSLLTLIEIIRSFIVNADSPTQLSDAHDCLRKMMAFMRGGASTNVSGTVNNFDPTALSQHALDSVMNYLARSPKRNNIVL